MKLAFSTLACPAWTIEQAAAAAQHSGYQGLELRLLDGALLRADIDRDTRRRVRRVCDQSGLSIVGLGTSVRLAQLSAAEREAHIREGLAFLELAAEWQVPFVRVFGGDVPDTVAQEDAAAAAAETLGPLAERARELGVAVILENHDAFCEGAAVAAVLRRVASPGAGALWDVLHSTRMGEPLETTLACLDDRLLHVHIKDGRRPPAGGPRWDLTLLGAGEVPIGAILQALHERGYSGWLSVEWEKQWHPELAEPDVALPQHAEVLRRYLNQLA